MCPVCESYRGGVVVIHVIWVSTLCTYDVRKVDLFVLSWARV